MFGSIQPTQYDLQFWLFRIPVRVHPLFWLIGTILGWNGSVAYSNGTGFNPLAFVIIWLLCLFTSILVHEFGHALTARACGWPVSVMLYHMGGVAMFRPDHRRRPWKMMLVAVMGPVAGFLLFGLVFAVAVGLALTGVSLDQLPLAGFAIDQLLYINLIWGLVNLLPVYPLDGGQILQNFLQQVGVRNDEIWTARTGVVVGGLVAAYFLTRQSLYPGLLFAYIAVMNYQSMQARRW